MDTTMMKTQTTDLYQFYQDLLQMEKTGTHMDTRMMIILTPITHRMIITTDIYMIMHT